MSTTKAVKNYSTPVIIIHWLSALVVIGMFALGWWMVDLDYYSQWYKTAPMIHKSIGILLVLVTLLRVLFKLIKAAPATTGKRYEVIAAKSVHLVIYFLLFVLFFSGYLISTPDGRGIEVFNWFTVPSLGELFPNQSDIAGRIHYYTAIILIGLAAVHAAAALKHHFIDKDDTLRKMIGASK
ncbi:cytochrome b [Reinekea marinisedimentorum]|uniref:Cytochrome b561 n=1 Tax=Reinekea marinisedimentorum TaxID=230495 RepID=A0A4V2UJK1_9GAMM|nr:cytochrome b [Reinekea marinisedimentorum]TCS40458.1 cytochrome b561 [Reinekea marinisedimentorum]